MVADCARDRPTGRPRTAVDGHRAGSSLCRPVIGCSANPAGLDLLAFSPELQRSIEQRVGIAAGRAIEFSLIESVRPGNPPMLIHHGSADEVEPIDHVRRFRDTMAQAGNECTLLEYEHARHAFHYPGQSGHFDDVIDATARFLLDRIAVD
jgi:acetyl esterase/lipase